MANSVRKSSNGRSTFVAQGGRPPTHLLAIIFGIPAILIVVFAILLGAKMLGSREQPKVVTDDSKLEKEINQLLGESRALYQKAYQAVTGEESNARVLVEQAVRKVDQLSERYSALMDNPEYRDPKTELFKPGYEWIGAKGGEIGLVRRDVYALKGF